MLSMIKRYTFSVLIVALACSSLVSCDDHEFVPDFDEEYVEGYMPIYGVKIPYADLEMIAARSVILPGKIITYGSYIILEEVGAGFHFIDNTDNTTPQKVGFLSVPNSSSIAIRDGVMYIDYDTDLLAIELNGDLSLNINALEDVFGQGQPDDLPPYSGYFECVDTTQGDVVEWERTQLFDPQCYYYYQGYEYD